MSDHLETYIEPELEARIVAMVLGEASEFEQEELERLVSERPELVLFRDRDGRPARNAQRNRQRRKRRLG